MCPYYSLTFPNVICLVVSSASLLFSSSSFWRSMSSLSSMLDLCMKGLPLRHVSRLAKFINLISLFYKICMNVTESSECDPLPSSPPQFDGQYRPCTSEPPRGSGSPRGWDDIWPCWPLISLYPLYTIYTWFSLGKYPNGDMHDNDSRI